MDWSKLLDYGVPLALLVGLLYFLRKDVYLPWRDRYLTRQVAVLDAIDQRDAENTETLKEMSSNFKIIAAYLEKVEQLCRERMERAPSTESPRESAPRGERRHLPPA